MQQSELSHEFRLRADSYTASLSQISCTDAKCGMIMCIVNPMSASGKTKKRYPKLIKILSDHIGT